MNDQSLEITAETDAAENTSQETEAKTYSQEEFDRHMAGLKKSLAKKYERQYADLGDPEELRKLKADAEKQRVDEQLNRGEFEKTLQELASKKDAEISQKDEIIRDYRVNTPLLDAAARYRAVAPEQVKSLLSQSVRLSNDGSVEVLDDSGSVRYNDSGELFTVDELVNEFLNKNPHFAQPTPATTNSSSNTGAPRDKRVKLEDLDLTNPEDRKIYREARSKGLI